MRRILRTSFTVRPAFPAGTAVAFRWCVALPPPVQPQPERTTLGPPPSRVLDAHRRRLASGTMWECKVCHFFACGADEDCPSCGNERQTPLEPIDAGHGRGNTADLPRRLGGPPEEDEAIRVEEPRAPLRKPPPGSRPPAAKPFVASQTATAAKAPPAGPAAPKVALDASGKWKCPSCGTANFASRGTCYKCQTAR